MNKTNFQAIELAITGKVISILYEEPKDDGVNFVLVLVAGVNPGTSDLIKFKLLFNSDNDVDFSIGDVVTRKGELNMKGNEYYIYMG